MIRRTLVLMGFIVPWETESSELLKCRVLSPECKKKHAGTVGDRMDTQLTSGGADIQAEP